MIIFINRDLYICMLGKFVKFWMLIKYWKWAAKRPIDLKWNQRPQSGPSVCNAAKGRKVAHHYVDRPISGIW